jgi:hypothetical protein
MQETVAEGSVGENSVNKRDVGEIGQGHSV